MKAEAFAAQHSTDSASSRRTFRVALDAFMSHCTVEKSLRGSTVHAYRKIGERLAERPWRSESAWADRILDTFSAEDLLAVRRELTQAERSADTINHYRRVVRGIFGTHPSSPALAWAWKTQKVESEGKLQFYTPEQVRKLIAEAYSVMDEAIYTLATEAGPRLSEIRALEGRQRRLRRRRSALRGRLHDNWRSRRQQGPQGAVGPHDEERPQGARAVL